jgi:hypothetical protein
MKQLILILAASFGFFAGAAAQDFSDPRNMVDPGTSAEVSAWQEECQITAAVESGTCAVTVGYQSDYFPVKFIQDGKVLKTIDSLSGPVKVEGVKYEILPHGVMKYVLEIRNPRGGTFIVNNDMEASEDGTVSYEDEEEEVIIQDYRTPKKVEVDSVEVLPPKLPDPDFDLISIEYVYTDELPETPVRVISLGQDGRSFTRNVNRFYTGFRVDDKGNVMVGVEVMATPYMVSPGETIYRVKLIMADGKRIKRKIVVLTDQP